MIEALGITGLIAALLVVAWVWRPQPPERGVRVLLAGYAVLGAWMLCFTAYAPGQEPAAFVFWKPTVFFWMLAIIVLGAPLLRWGYPFKAIFGTFFALSTAVWRRMNLASGALFVVLGTVNLLVAFNLSEGNWDGFKYSCRVLLMFIILLRLNFVWLDLVSRMVISLYRRAKALFP
jgi:intracellular septation protein A